MNVKIMNMNEDNEDNEDNEINMNMNVKIMK